MLSRNMPERKISLREKIWYQKICFQFSCDLYDARVWQTSSQSNIILFTICFVCQRIQIHSHLRSLFSYTDWVHIERKKSAPMKWNGMVKIRWKRTSDSIFGRMWRIKWDTGKKIWWIWKLIIYHVECSESYRLCLGENWKRRTLSMWIRCTMTRHDPQLWWLAPNYVWIDIFITCFHAHCSHSNQVEHWIF